VTVQELETLQATEARKLEAKVGAARRIRELLDTAREQFGADEWDENCIETEVLELVTEDAAS